MCLAEIAGVYPVHDHLLVAAPDEKHSATEARIYVLRRTDAGRRVFVVCTLRRNRIRVISARTMSRKERELYDENK